jgi:eukaryotic-like serine/threonine-protein kinase
VSRPDALVAGRYRLVDRIAAGGMGSVWEAWDEVLQRRVALKQLHPQPGLSKAEAQLAGSRAMREARITARLHHAHAVPVYDVVDHEGQPCLIMQYLPSQSLQALLAERGTLSVAEVARIGSEVAAALAAAHQAGVVHRDVKPGNVLIAQDGSAKLTDFGISHALGDATLTSTGLVTGTPAFLAPEVARGVESGFPSDVFSLGSTLYAALEGTPPFGTGENPMAVLHRVASGRPAPPRRSGPLTPVLLRMLAPEPEARPSMDEVARELDAIRVATAGSADAATRPISAPAAVGPATTVTLPAAGSAGAGASAGPLQALPPGLLPPRLPPSLPSLPPRQPGSPTAQPPGPPPRRRRGTLVVALAALLLVIVVGAVLVARALQGGSANHTAGSSSSTTPRTGSTARASGTTSHPPTSAARTSSTPPPATPTSTAGAPAAGGGEAKPGQLAKAVEDYYALLPANTDEAWQRLTPQYQQSHAGGRQAYQSFWDSIAKVDASKAKGQPPGSVEATITYTYKDGRVVDERTAFQLVRQDGIFKIDATTVLSSTTR